MGWGLEMTLELNFRRINGFLLAKQSLRWVLELEVSVGTTYQEETA